MAFQSSEMESEMANQELKYVEKLDISTLTISRVKEIIKRNIMNTLYCWKEGLPMEKQTFHIIGPAGVGKTQICYQIADELTKEMGAEFQTIMIKCPVLSRDDFLIPFPIIQGEINKTKKFEMLYSDFVPTDPKSFGLFVIDEFSRGDHALQQLMWQVQNEGKLHLYDFPKGWFCISIDNPDDQEYSMDTMEDAAGLRRMLHIYTEVNAKDFLNYAIAQEFHPGVIEFIQAHPERVYDFDAQKRGSVYANPASWERMSNVLKGYDVTGGSMMYLEDIDVLASGLINTSMARLFVEFLKENKGINPKDIVNNYNKVRGKIKKMLKANDNAALGEVMVGFTTYLSTSMPKMDKEKLNNFIEFILDMPIDTAALFITQLDSLDRRSKAFAYVTDLHTAAVKSSKQYMTEFYQKIIRTSKS